MRALYSSGWEQAAFAGAPMLLIVSYVMYGLLRHPGVVSITGSVGDDDDNEHDDDDD